MISISLIDPPKPETPVELELELEPEPEFEPAATDPPPPQDIRIAQVKVMKCFIIFSQKNYLNITKKKPSSEGFFFGLFYFNLQLAQ